MEVVVEIFFLFKKCRLGTSRKKLFKNFKNGAYIRICLLKISYTRTVIIIKKLIILRKAMTVLPKICIKMRFIVYNNFKVTK